jgi:hypothetical protein
MLVLAAIAVALHTLDLASGIRLMLVFGIDQEQNPISRTIFQMGGPVALSIAKYGVVLSGVTVLLLIASAGRPKLARASLILVALVGLIGFASNLVW